MGVVMEDLSDDERYLFAILEDVSGLDLAEFTWVDESQKHDLPNSQGEVGIRSDDPEGREVSPGSGCWRARPYQWAWFRNRDRQQIDQCGRSVGKSLSIQLRGFAFPFLHPGEEMVVTAPELNHLEPITDLIESRFRSVRLGQMMMAGGRSGITHRPFKMNFKNRARIFGRIPQKDGKGVKGIHPLWLELDEAQDFPHPGWIELNETLKFGQEGAVWRAHGVTKGVRDDFFEYTQQGSGWTVHRFTGMHRPPPDWSDAERDAKVRLYHGADSGDYRRNILGEHGDSTSPIFNLFRLMACVDDDQESPYNSDEYVHYEIIDSWLRQADTTIEQELDLPTYHTAKYKTFWVGMDVGWTNHPSEIVVFAEEQMTPEEYKAQKGRKDLGRGKAVPATRDIPRLKLLTRITMTRIGSPDQKTAILKVIEHYKPKAFSFDATGAGLPMFQDIQRTLEDDPNYNYIKTIVKGYNFSGNILVAFDDTIEVSEWATKEDYIKETGIKRNTVDYATDQLRILIDSGRFWLPWDVDLTNEFGGQTYKVTNTALNQWGRREYCVDETTEIMTSEGWKTHGQLRGDESVLTLNPGTFMSEFKPILSVNRFEGQRSMLSMENRGHSSLTTMDHRWLVRRLESRSGRTSTEWATSKDLKAMRAIPKVAPCDSLPEHPTLPDSLVEIVGWYWTEGWLNSGACAIGQSETANPAKVKRIRLALESWLGPARKGLWTECPQKTGMVIFRVSKSMSGPILEAVGAEKELRPEWLMGLTQEQLDLLIDVSIQADGHRATAVTDGYISHETTFSQSSERRIRSFEMACALAGKATKTSMTSGPGMFHTRILTSRNFQPYNTKRTIVEHEGLVWCPTTENGTFLARRNGTVYYTGNSLGKFHALDACRMMALGWAQYAIEEFVKNDPDEPIIDLFGY